MRIALLTPGFSASDRDWCIPVLQDLAISLNARHDVQVYATCFPHDTCEYRVKGVAVKSFGDGKAGRIPWLRRQLRALQSLINDHQKEPFDLVHGFWTDGGGFVGALFKRKYTVPIIVTTMAGELTHEPQIAYGKARRPIAGRLARFGARHADTLIVNSHWHADRLRAAEAGLDPQLAPFGFDATRFEPDGPAVSLQGDTPLLCVASLVPVKGHAILLQAFAAASARVAGLHLHLVGQGELEAALRGVTDRLGLSGVVTFHGHVEHHRLAEYYRAASFCVLSSYFESHGMVILEAAGCGRVTLGSDVGSMREFCPAELLTAPGDAPALASSIEALVLDMQRRRSVCATACRNALDNFTLVQSVAEFERVYTRTLRSKLSG